MAPHNSNPISLPTIYGTMMICRHGHHQQLLLLCRLSRVDGGIILSSSSPCRQAVASLNNHLVTPHHDFQQPRSIHTEAQAATSTANSKRLDFKSTPIIPSILSRIEKIGVGIRPKPSRKKRRPSSIKGVHGDNDAHTLDEIEEREYFKQNRITSRNNSSIISQQRNNGSSKKADSSNHGHRGNKQNQDGKKKHDKLLDDSNNSKVGAYWLPPPPFSTYTKGGTTTSSRQRRSVKILGSAASLNDELPRESKGLSEVALAGRSNVGKSTLLNALLYGNIDINLAPRQFQRGRTPEGAKLPKGVKAVTSDKPGETKQINFYQLSADVAVASTPCNSEDEAKVKGKVVKVRDDNHEAGSETNENNDRHLKYSLVLVDLPGFGFAFAKEEKAKEWNDLMHHYLLERKTLKRILLLLDARHGFKVADFEFLETLQEGLKQQNNSSSREEDNNNESGGRRKKKRRELPPIQIVLTKCDLVKQVDLARRVVVVRQQLSDALARETSSLPVMLVSARAGLGFNNIRGAEQQPMGGVLELQKELASLVPVSKVDRKK